MKQKDIPASYTVEAALLFPCIFFVIFALLFMCFYLQDKVLLNGIVNCYCERESRFVAVGTNPENNIVDYEHYLERGILYPWCWDFGKEEERLQKLIYLTANKSLNVCSIQRIQVKVGSFSVEVEVWYTLNFPLVPIRRYFSGRMKQQKIDGVNMVHHPAEFVRVYDSLGDIVSKEKGDKEIKNRLQKIYNIFSGK